MIVYYKAENRKPLVQAISEFVGVKAVYMKTPTYAYKIAHFMVTREGNLEFDDMSDRKEIERLIEYLAEKGFVADTMTSFNDNEEVIKDSINEPHSENFGLTVSMPRDKVSIENLTKILETKGELIKKALGVDDLPISFDDEKVSFPWFTVQPNADEVKAYTHFIAELCKMSKGQKRINTKEKTVENEKYAFRCFLLRLGFIGAEYKAERKLLLKNLTGSSAFKKEKNNENTKQRFS
ncbi:MAG: virulence protein [Ruminococcus sp.]